MSKHFRNNQKGFTIVELMIATAVFAVIVMVVSMAVIQISRTYYKGLTQSATQNTSRRIMDTVSQAIQFNGGTVTSPNLVGGAYVFCVNDQRFTFKQGEQYVEGGEHRFVQDTVAICGGTVAHTLSAAALTGGDKELLSPSMRIVDLKVTPKGDSLYEVSIKVAYGDDDLLDNPNGTDASCKGGIAGGQFCAVSELTTVVNKRVE